ncbi:Phosphoglycolate phosphatase [subsurface metagenome]
MIKAIFFDWFYTLARYEPPREELYSRVFAEFGIQLAPQEIMPGILAADRYYFEENARSSVMKRDPKAQAEVFIGYNSLILNEAGLELPQEQLLKIMKRVQELFKGATFVLFDDVLSALKTLKERKLILGLLTNATKDLVAVHHKLGLESYLDFVVTSEEAGADKPNPPIFRLALERAGVDASEAVHVGDQYSIDVVGARGVGINPILIDRYNISPEVTDCPRIHSLTEVAQRL